MTISELIILLQSYPKDAIVVNDMGIVSKEDIYIQKEFYNGDSANPNCEILKDVVRID